MFFYAVLFSIYYSELAFYNIFAYPDQSTLRSIYYRLHCLFISSKFRLSFCLLSCFSCHMRCVCVGVCRCVCVGVCVHAADTTNEL